MAAPASAVTISRAAEILGEDEELLWDLVDEMEPEDGCLWVYGTTNQHTIAFTDRGLECRIPPVKAALPIFQDCESCDYS